MKNLFVSYDIAKKLKELGFNEPCLAWYMSGNIDINMVDASDVYNFPITNSHIAISYDKLPQRCTAPLYQQVVDWFREKHNIHIRINPNTIDGSTFTFTYNFYPTNLESPINYLRYYEALDIAILESIKLISK